MEWRGIQWRGIQWRRKEQEVNVLHARQKQWWSGPPMGITEAESLIGGWQRYSDEFSQSGSCSSEATAVSGSLCSPALWEPSCPLPTACPSTGCCWRAAESSSAGPDRKTHGLEASFTRSHSSWICYFSPLRNQIRQRRNQWQRAPMQAPEHTLTFNTFQMRSMLMFVGPCKVKYITAAIIKIWAKLTGWVNYWTLIYLQLLEYYHKQWPSRARQELFPGPSFWHRVGASWFILTLMGSFSRHGAGALAEGEAQNHHSRDDGPRLWHRIVATK